MLAFAAGLAFTPLARRLAIRTGDLDRPIGEKIHKMPTPLLGGLAVYLAFACTALTVLPLTTPVVGVLVGGLVALAVGIGDEFFDLPPLLHLAGQIGAAIIALVAGVGAVRTVSLPATLATPGLHLPLLVGAGLTVVWLVGMMNTMNFLDGLDGLAAGVGCIAALLLAAWASNLQRFLIPVTAHHEDLYLPLALAGALLGFLPYNWHVARIFLGDSGSMFVGLALGALSIVGPAKLGTGLLILLIPILDVAWAIVRRQLRGRSFLAGDKQHVYHRMLELGLGHTQTVVTLYALCIVLAGLDLWLIKLQKVIAFIVLTLVASGAFIWMEVKASGRPLGSSLPVRQAPKS